MLSLSEVEWWWVAGAESVNIISQFDPPGRSDNTDMIMTSQQYFDQSQLLESSTPYTDAIRVRKYFALKAQRMIFTL